MTIFDSLSGVYAAAVTPLRDDLSTAVEDLPPLLEFLAGRGCDGALLLGTTGEGPSFSSSERHEIFQAATAIRSSYPGFRLLAGTGTPSLTETVQITRMAFDSGFDGAVVLPPYYFRKVSDEGLFTWFSQVIRQAVPPGKALFAYHIPPVTGIAFSTGLLSRLLEAFPDRFAGLKDSSADPLHAISLGEHFSKDLLVFNGNDRLFGLALQHSASGCITALANLSSPDLATIWEAHQSGDISSAAEAQKRLDETRPVLDAHPPAPAFLKAMLARLHGLPRWPVRPPLLPLPESEEDAIAAELEKAA